MDVAFEKLLYQSTQGYAKNNPTKFEVLTPSGSSVYQIFIWRHQWAWSTEIFCMNRFRVIHGTVLLDIKFHKKMLFPNFVSDIINGCGLQEIRVMQRISVSNFRFWGPFPVHLFSTRTLIFNSHMWFATRTFDLQLVHFFLNSN